MNPAVRAQQVTYSDSDDSDAQHDQAMIPVGVGRDTGLWRCDLIKGTFTALRGGTAEPRSEMPEIDGLCSPLGQLRASLQPE